MARRSTADWEARAKETMDRVRASGAPGRRGSRQALVGLLLAASMLLFALLAPRRPDTAVSAPDTTASSELSPADQEDDDLLRDIQRVARGEELWNPLPADDTVADESL
jgi:hypothetical protein